MKRLPHNYINLEGLTFNRLIVTSTSETRKDKSGKTRRYWLCKCICGKEVFVSTYSLRSERTKSCGCLQKERVVESNTKHDLISKKIRNIYSGILQRCYNQNDSAYKYYGGRGIKVCDRWLESFGNFLTDVLLDYKEGLSIDRIDTNGDYSPDNFRWVDRTTQAFNRNSFGSSEFRGVSKGHKYKWRARVILEGGKEIYLGQYYTEIEAALAYNDYVKNHNLPNMLNNLEGKV